MGKTFKDRRHIEFSGKMPPRAFRYMPEFKKKEGAIRTMRCEVTGKVGFFNYGDAETRSREILRGGTRDGTIAFRVYECEFCHRYHLTKKV
jgi:hypothetical protein